MIVGHQHRYLFVEVAYAGSTAVAEELIEHYDGQRVLAKHATLAEAATGLGPAVASYRLATGVRDPLDAAVSRYFKLVTNHRGNFTRPERWERHGGWVGDGHLAQFDLVQAGADFTTWFLHTHDDVYVSPWWRAQRAADVLLRYETLERDFNRFVGSLGLQPVRRLPQRNPTAARPGDHRQLYDDPAVQRRAVAVFGPYMRAHNYRWPDSWGIGAPPPVSRLLYRGHTSPWRHLFPSGLRGSARRLLERLRRGRDHA